MIPVSGEGVFICCEWCYEIPDGIEPTVLVYCPKHGKLRGYVLKELPPKREGREGGRTR